MDYSSHLSKDNTDYSMLNLLMESLHSVYKMRSRILELISMFYPVCTLGRLQSERLSVGVTPSLLATTNCVLE